MASVVIAFAQISLGGIVRASESGLGCPDWPLCHGQLLPPFEFHTLVEYSHRLTGTILGILVLLSLWIAILKREGNRDVMKFTVVSLFLVVTAGLLGGLTVLTELAWWVRLIHLSIAQILIANLVVLAWIIFHKQENTNPISTPAITNSVGKLIIVISLVFLLILSGSYMVGIGASSSCSTWPLCRGEFLPEGFEYSIHMAHRYFAAIVTLYVGIVAIKFIREKKDYVSLKRASHSALGLMIVQIVFGALIVWSGFDSYLKALHLSIATLVWLGTVLMATAATLNFEEK
jgi:heme A synthase